MGLKEKLLNDLKEAMKSSDVIRKNTVQMARAAILQVEKDNRITLEDDGIIEVIAKEAKKRKDSLPEYEKSGRVDLIENLKREYNILLAYLPEQLSDEDIEKIVKDVISETGASSVRDMGKVIKAAMDRTKGRADGKVISETTKKLLA